METFLSKSYDGGPILPQLTTFIYSEGRYNEPIEPVFVEVIRSRLVEAEGCIRFSYHSLTVGQSEWDQLAKLMEEYPDSVYIQMEKVKPNRADDEIPPEE